MKKNGFLILLVIVVLVALAACTSGEDDKMKDILMFEIEEESFNLKMENDNDLESIQVGYNISYPQELETIVNSNKSAIKEITTKYFLNLTKDDLKKDGAINKARDELKTRLNDFFIKNKKVNGEIVYEIVFTQWKFL